MRKTYAFTAISILLYGCTPRSDPAFHAKNELTNSEFRDASPRWSPDGSRIAFMRVYDERRVQLWVADSALGSMLALTEPDSVRWARPPLTGRSALAAADAPEWSPDGRRIAMSRGVLVDFDAKRRVGGTDIWTVEVDSGRMAPLAVHPEKYDGDLQFYRAPAWSPSGKYVAYLAEGIYGFSSLVVHTLGATRSGDQSIPADLIDDYGWPVWSPDGKWLAYRQSLFQSESALPVESIRMIAPGTSRARTIIVKGDEPRELLRASHLAWSPDARNLAVRIRAQEPDLPASMAVFDADSGRRLTVETSYSPTSLMWLKHKGAQKLYGLQLRGVMGNVLDGEDSPWNGVVLPSDDFDVSPDGTMTVVHNPQLKGPAAKTTLQVLRAPR